MNYCTKDKVIKSAKRAHQCSWCAESIEVGGPYVRYRYYSDDGPVAVKLHSECKEACDALATIEQQIIEFRPGDHPRGRYES